MKQPWRGRRVWIVGASSGIGAELARQLLAAGAKVALTARRSEPLAQLAFDYPDQALVLPADLRDAEVMAQVAHQLELAWGALDLVIANAGTSAYVRPRDLDLDLFEEVFAVNYFGALRTLACAYPLLCRGERPQAAVTSSLSTYLPLPRAEAYGASKRALQYSVEALRVSWQPQGIDLSVISPGFVSTPMTADNDFSMPWMMEAEPAAQRILRGLLKRQRHIVFPWRLRALMRLISWLPMAWYLRLAQRLVKERV